MYTTFVNEYNFIIGYLLMETNVLPRREFNLFMPKQFYLALATSHIAFSQMSEELSPSKRTENRAKKNIRQTDT